MGGRGGRGGGRGMSFSLEQMGIARGDALPTPVLTPPPHYPMLEHYPAIMAPAPRHHAMLTYRSDFLKHLSQYSERLQPPGPNTKRPAEQEPPSEELRLDFDWSRFPFELRPSVTRKRKGSSDSKATKGKQQKLKNFEALLEELEKKEEVVVKKEVDEEEGGQNEEEEMEEEDDADEEMDEGTDYNQNYFDNGEGFLDEDDDADDSPVY